MFTARRYLYTVNNTVILYNGHDIHYIKTLLPGTCFHVLMQLGLIAHLPSMP